ncbi:MAG: hypothetical protein IID31_09955 [Planctomycetes bacterium]|nr:hypothetical protein [Planctomycetota bacterium]
MTSCACIHRRGHRGGGFARVEAAAIGFVVVVGVALMLAVSPSGRRAAMVNRDLANLRQIGAWTFAYGNDYEDVHPSFTSAPNSQWPALRPTGFPIPDAAKQAIDIIRRRTGRVTFPLPGNWIPHVLYTHLVLADYLDRQLPDSFLVSSGDRYRMNWLDDPINKHDLGFWQPFQQPTPGSGPVPPSQKRWAYSSSYQTPPAFYDEGQNHWSGRRPVLSQGSHNSYYVPSGVVLRGQNMSGIAFPGQKVLFFDNGSWYTSRRAQYYAVETSTASALMCDGGAALRRTAEANQGWRPVRPWAATPTRFIYQPRPWEPATANGQLSEQLIGYYRWTRGGIMGRDFDGPEIDTGQR